MIISYKISLNFQAMAFMVRQWKIYVLEYGQFLKFDDLSNCTNQRKTFTEYKQNELYEDFDCLQKNGLLHPRSFWIFLKNFWQSEGWKTLYTISKPNLEVLERHINCDSFKTKHLIKLLQTIKRFLVFSDLDENRYNSSNVEEMLWVKIK